MASAVGAIIGYTMYNPNLGKNVILYEVRHNSTIQNKPNKVNVLFGNK